MSVGRPDLLLQAVMRLAPGRKLSVLVFHRLLTQRDPLRPGEPTVAEFEARMRWISENFEVLPLAFAARALHEGRLPKRALCITFDDGYADNHELALPVLRRLRLHATFFVATGYLDGGCMFNDVVIEAVRQAPGEYLDLSDLGLGRPPLGRTDKRLLTINRLLSGLKYFETERRDTLAREIARRAGAGVPDGLMMTTAQVRSLHAAGMAVGGHTVSHPILAGLSTQRARDEMAVGRAQLERITGAPVRLFAYPNGRPQRDYYPEHAALAQELGFEAAVSSAWGAARPGDDLYQIPRFTPWDRANWRFGLRLATNRLSSRYARA